MGDGGYCEWLWHAVRSKVIAFLYAKYCLSICGNHCHLIFLNKMAAYIFILNLVPATLEIWCVLVGVCVHECYYQQLPSLWISWGEVANCGFRGVRLQYLALIDVFYTKVCTEKIVYILKEVNKYCCVPFLLFWILFHERRPRNCLGTLSQSSNSHLAFPNSVSEILLKKHELAENSRLRITTLCANDKQLEFRCVACESSVDDFKQ